MIKLIQNVLGKVNICKLPIELDVVEMKELFKNSYNNDRFYKDIIFSKIASNFVGLCLKEEDEEKKNNLLFYLLAINEICHNNHSIHKSLDKNATYYICTNTREQRYISNPNLKINSYFTTPHASDIAFFNKEDVERFVESVDQSLIIKNLLDIDPYCLENYYLLFEKNNKNCKVFSKFHNVFGYHTEPKIYKEVEDNGLHRIIIENRAEEKIILEF